MDYYNYLERQYQHDCEAPILFGHCSKCGGKIYEEDIYYNIYGEIWCESCMDDAKRYAEVRRPVYESY